MSSPLNVKNLLFSTSSASHSFTITIAIPQYIAWITLTGISMSILIFLISQSLSNRNDKNLKNKHIWLIGSTRGIGKATAHLLYSKQSILTLSSRDSVQLTVLQQTLENLYPNIKQSITIQPLDIRSSLDALHSAIPNNLDILILNAGINQKQLEFSSTSPSLIDDIIDTNLRAALRLSHLCLPQLRASKGTLCVISSLAAYRGLPGATVYSATKAALTVFCQALAVEMKPHGVDVVCVHPGFVNTPAIDGLNHPKIFMMRDVDAADKIVKAIEQRKNHTGFPWVMEHLVMKFATCVPTPLYNFILSRPLMKRTK